MSSGGNSDTPDLEHVYSILGNPVKRRLVMLLGERGPMTFSELKRALKVSVGTLYYNLDGLRGFITRDEARRYLLTEEGMALYRALREGSEIIRSAFARRGRLKRIFDDYVLSILVPQQLVAVLYRDNPLSLAVLATCVILGSLSTLISRLPLKLLEVEQIPLLSPRLIGGILVPPTPLLLAEYLVSLLAVLALTYAIARLIIGRAPLTPGFVAALALAYVPLYAYMAVHFAVTGYSYPLVPRHVMMGLALLFRLLQVATLGLITAAVSVFCDTSRERGFLVAALLLYVSFLLKPFLP